MEGTDDEPLELSSSTMAILSQFLAERRQAEEEASTDPFVENWGMSQVGQRPLFLHVPCVIGSIPASTRQP